MNKIFLTDTQVTDAITKWLSEADADDLARAAGELFGGECFYEDAETGYIFTPDENYYGQFD